MKVLVTGASGFLGYPLLDLLREIGAEIHIIDPKPCLDADFRTLGWDDWIRVPPGPGDRWVATPRARIRIPDVVLFPNVSRLPKAEVRFNRKNAKR